MPRCCGLPNTQCPFKATGKCVQFRYAELDLCPCCELERRSIDGANVPEILINEATQFSNKMKYYLASALIENNRKGFWSSVKKSTGKKNVVVNNIDNCNNSDDISLLFAEKYDSLYKSVGYCSSDMKSIISTLDKMSSANHCVKMKCVQKHYVSEHDVVSGMKKLKFGKGDVQSGLITNHIIYGGPVLWKFLSMVFNVMITHSFAPNNILCSTIIPIPKNNRKSLNDSNNYRSIVMCSALSKLLDYIILEKFENVLVTSDSQFGFKKGHSTTQCSFVVNEVIQYYKNRNSNVYITMLDASKAFDKVNYVKLFKLLIKMGLCPLYCRFMVNLYTLQSLNVKWGNCHLGRTGASGVSPPPRQG